MTSPEPETKERTYTSLKRRTIPELKELKRKARGKYWEIYGKLDSSPHLGPAFDRLVEFDLDIAIEIEDRQKEGTNV